MPRTDAPATFNAATFFVARHLAEGRGHRTAVRCCGRSLTYEGLADRVARTAGALGALGVEMEQRVLIALPDSPELAATFWGAVAAGAVAVPVNPWLAAADYEFLLADSRARVAVVDAAVAERLLSVRGRCPHLRAIAVAGPGPAQHGALSLADLLDRAPREWNAAPTVRDDVMFWGYTSGSTGPPKAALHTHADFVAAADLVGVGIFGLGVDDVTFSASKMFFSFGLGNSLFFPARVGAAAVLVPGRIDPELAFDVITRERPTAFFAVATVYARMLQVPDAERRFDLSSLRLCVSSGEALPPVVYDAWAARFGHELVDVVGSTEALHDFIANRPGKTRRGSCGQIVPGFEARLVDEDGRSVEPGQVGHLVIKGPTTALGYWHSPERTRATMQGDWLRTGDMMTCDDDGYFYFAGRSDDMLKVAGQWVSPAEIEACLAAHPAVVEVGVAGGPDGQGLVRAQAWVVVKEGAVPGPALEAELTAFVHARLPGHKVPRRVLFVAELPKTATGKIQRFRLRAQG